MSRRLLALLLVLAAGATVAPVSAHAAPPVPSAKAMGAGSSTPDELTYSELRKAISARTVARAELHPARGLADITLRGGRKAAAAYPVTDEQLAKDLADAGAEVTVDNRAKLGGLQVLSMLMMPLLLLGFVVFMFIRSRQSQTGGGPGGVTGRQTVDGAKVEDTAIPQVEFSDVAGVDEAVESLQDLLVFLTEPERFQKLGAVLPRGVIFHGPPGTGKTLLARALAGEAGVPFFSVSGSEFVEMLVGRGAARVRSLFEDARKHEAAVIFFDEFDALGKRRGNGVNGNDEREQTLNQLLVEMDGFAGDSRIICIAATNRLDTLDPAVLRPGRFGMQLLVDLPSEQGRRDILAVHARSKPLAGEVDLDRLARITYGSSGADLADMLNRAAILAGKAHQDEITQANLEDGYLDAIAGPVKRSRRAGRRRARGGGGPRGRARARRRAVPEHREGDARVDPAARARRRHGRLRPHRPHAARPAVPAREAVGVLGGRAAEFVTRGVITSGAANDLQQANAMARQAVEELGFSAKAGQLVSSRGGESMRVSEQTVAVIDDEVRRLVDDAYQDAIRLLQAHRDELERLAAALLEHEDLDRPEIVAVLAGVADEPRATPQRAAASPQPALAVADRPALPAPVLATARGVCGRASRRCCCASRWRARPGYTGRVHARRSSSPAIRPGRGPGAGS